MKLMKGRFDRKLMLFLLYLVINSVSGQLRHVGKKRTVHCVQVGQNDDRGPFTIGGKRFEPRDKLPMRNDVQLSNPDVKQFKQESINKDTWKSLNACPAGLELNYDDKASFFYTEYCPEEIEIRTYLVRQTHSYYNKRMLRGWLHVEVEITDPSDEMEYIYVQMRDRDFNAIGEFVTNKEEQCKPSKGELISPSQFQHLPCSATSWVEPKTGQAIFMAKASQYANERGTKGFIPTQQLKRGIHFTWRMSEYFCNQHLRIRVDAEVWTKKNMLNFAKFNEDNRKGNKDEYCTDKQGKDCILKRKISEWMYPKWYGAADIKLDGAGELDCTLPVFASNGALNPEGKETWLKDRSGSVKVEEDYTHTDSNVYPLNTSTGEDTDIRYVRSCQVEPNPKGIQKSDIVTFGGRCGTFKEKNVAHSYFQGCKKRRPIEGKWFTNHYRQALSDLAEQRMNLCGHECKLPDINKPEDLEDIKSYPGGTTGSSSIPKSARGFVLLENMKKARVQEMRDIFWITRKFHGIVCIFLAMFLIPLSHFVARYYKETFTKGNWMGLKPWLGFHLLVCFLVPALFFATMFPMWYNIDSFGRSQSKHATFHYTYGYALMATFMLITCIGGFRPVKRLALIVCMALHAVAGFVLNTLAIILVCLSCYIPASPSADECDPDSELPVRFSFVAQVSVVRVCMDIVFHIFLTCVQRKVDNRHRVRRQGFGLPFVPMLPGTTLNDLVGYRFRRAALVIYGVFTFALSVMAMWDLWEKEDMGNCTLGEMSCNMSQTLPNQASSPFGCSAVAVKYYASFVAKHKIDLS